MKCSCCGYENRKDEGRCARCGRVLACGGACENCGLCRGNGMHKKIDFFKQLFYNKAEDK